ncbi:MAG: BspA family leucine-rich repeat surface protein [Saccharospirillaceae bacterium]|nr:BspA family leucine-rich repeat surface protein [Pseudomonadales bacterium]NRB80527.1 BspA family leucine-rich repeat surface protein [Saccharospirillaceae bacterium]
MTLVLKYSFFIILSIIITACNDSDNNSSTDMKIQTVIGDYVIGITLIGEPTVIVYLGNEYEELGAFAIDDDGNELSYDIEGEVDTQILGIYELTYVLTDSQNNQMKIKRTVRVLPDAFTTIWKTDNEGVSENNQIRLEVNSDFSYDYTVDWGDGLSDNNVLGEITHTYELAGSYLISITGVYPQIFFYNVDSLTSDSKKLISVENWGTNTWLSMAHAFYGCENMQLNTSDKPDLSSVKDMSNMFYASGSFNQDINDWDVSSVTNMEKMFAYATTFNQDLSNWDVSLVKDMSRMFYSADSFNQDIGVWDVSSLTNMDRMFSYALTFNKDLSAWQTSSVTDMFELFRVASDFNQNISTWDVSSVTNMSGMFISAPNFNQELNDWNVSSVTDMSYMFAGAIVFNKPLNNWNVSSVVNMNAMFNVSRDFNQDISNWDVSSVIKMGGNGTYDTGMFEGATNFDQDVSLWNISNVLEMDGMFKNIQLSTINYDALLTSWSNQIPQENVMFDGGNSQYTKGSLAETARTYLTDSLGWIITDGGAAVVEVQAD